MAYRAFGTCLDEQCVLVAVQEYILDVKEIAACLALGPKAVSGAAPECDLSGLDSLVIGLFVHETKHQDLARHIVLNDGGYKAAHFLKIDIHWYIYNLIGIFKLQRYCFNSGIGISPK